MQKKHAACVCVCVWVVVGAVKRIFHASLIKSLPLIFTRFSVFLCHRGGEGRKEGQQQSGGKKKKMKRGGKDGGVERPVAIFSSRRPRNVKEH